MFTKYELLCGLARMCQATPTYPLPAFGVDIAEYIPDAKDMAPASLKVELATGRPALLYTDG